VAELTQKQESISNLVASRVQQLDDVTARASELQHNTSSLLEAGLDPRQLVTLKASISELQSEIKGLEISSGESRGFAERTASVVVVVVAALC
jgi:hypothetical protein